MEDRAEVASGGARDETLPVRFGKERRDCESCRQREATLFFAARNKACWCQQCANENNAEGGVPISSVRSVGKHPQCQKHRDQLLSVFCEKTGEALCNTCIAAPEHAHTHLSLDDNELEEKLKRRIARSKLILERGIRHTTAVRAELRTACAEISGAKLVIGETADSTKRRIEERFDFLAKLLSRRKEELTAQVDGLRDGKFKKLEEQKTEMEGHVRRLDAALELSQSVLDDDDYMELVTLAERLEGHLRVDASQLYSSAGEPNTVDAAFEAAGEASLEEVIKRYGRVGLRLPKPRPTPEPHGAKAGGGEPSRPQLADFHAAPVSLPRSSSPPRAPRPASPLRTLPGGQPRPAASPAPQPHDRAYIDASRVPPGRAPLVARVASSHPALASAVLAIAAQPATAGLPLRFAAGGGDGCLRVYEVLDKGVPLVPKNLVRAHDGALTGGAAAVRACALIGNLVATGGDEGTVKIFDFASLECLAELPDRGETVTALAAAGSRLFVGTADGRVRMYALLGQEPATRRWGRELFVQLIRTMVARNRGAPVASLAASPRLLAAGFEDGTVKLWDAQSGGAGDTGPALFRAHADAVTAVALGRSMLATGGADGCIKVWSLRDVNRTLASRGSAPGGLRPPPCVTVAYSDGPVHSLAFALTLPHVDDEMRGVGELLVSASPKGGARLWHPDSGELAADVAGGEAGDCTAVCVAGGVVFTGRSSGFVEMCERLFLLAATDDEAVALPKSSRATSPLVTVSGRFLPSRASSSSPSFGRHFHY